MPVIEILVGWPGSGKSTYAKEMVINRPQVDLLNETDSEWLVKLEDAIFNGRDVIIDRQHITVKKRRTLLSIIRNCNGTHSYIVKAVVFRTSITTCVQRMLDRPMHPSINDYKKLKQAISWAKDISELPTIEEGFDIIISINTEQVRQDLYSSIFK